MTPPVASLGEEASRRRTEAEVHTGDKMKFQSGGKKNLFQKVFAEDLSRAPRRNHPEMSAGSLTPERAWRWV